jgi:hypothetical protein
VVGRGGCAFILSNRPKSTFIAIIWLVRGLVSANLAEIGSNWQISLHQMRRKCSVFNAPPAKIFLPAALQLDHSALRLLVSTPRRKEISEQKSRLLFEHSHPHFNSIIQR